MVPNKQLLRNGSSYKCSLFVFIVLIVRISAWVPSPLPSKFYARHALSKLHVTTSNIQNETMLGTNIIETDNLAPIPKRNYKRQGKLLKQVRKVCRDYQMLEDGDHIMVCVSGGKDSATLLYLLRLLQQSRLTSPNNNDDRPISFQLTAVHVDQKQPGYNGTTLVQWLRDDLKVPYKIVEEDTYSIVVDKTPKNKSFCTVCSRLRRGILYSTALELGCNKIALGHHADDAMETMWLNMIHAGQIKAMPARYTSNRGSLAVMRPLIASLEEDIAAYAQDMGFPILPCNLCSNQADLQRPQVKLLLSTLESFNPNAKQNILRAMGDVRPSHMLDQDLRESCGLDPITGDSMGGLDNGIDDNEDDSNLAV